MTDAKKQEQLRLTPPPSYSSDALAKAIIETGQSIKFIREDLLPPLVKDTKEARDKAREALQKVDTHIGDSDAHEHPCIEQPRQARQDDDIGQLKGVKEKVEGTSKLVWWLMGIAVTVALVAGGFAVSVRVSAAENRDDIDDNVEDIDENEDAIKALAKSQQADRETYLREMRDLPRQVTNAAKRPSPTIDEYQDAADELPLTEREQEQLLKLLKRAQQRTNGGEHKQPAKQPAKRPAT